MRVMVRRKKVARDIKLANWGGVGKIRGMETTALENLHQKGDFEGAIVWCQAKIAQNDG
jgi:hypothetical protein